MLSNVLQSLSASTQNSLVTQSILAHWHNFYSWDDIRMTHLSLPLLAYPDILNSNQSNPMAERNQPNQRRLTSQSKAEKSEACLNNLREKKNCATEHICCENVCFEDIFCALLWIPLLFLQDPLSSASDLLPLLVRQTYSKGCIMSSSGYVCFYLVVYTRTRQWWYCYGQLWVVVSMVKTSSTVAPLTQAWCCSPHGLSSSEAIHRFHNVAKGIPPVHFPLPRETTVTAEGVDLLTGETTVHNLLYQHCRWLFLLPNKNTDITREYSL